MITMRAVLNKPMEKYISKNGCFNTFDCISSLLCFYCLSKSLQIIQNFIQCNHLVPCSWKSNIVIHVYMVLYK
jgi:hypothetical protein